MDFKRKIELAQQSIRSISMADDKDHAVRAAALSALDDFIIAERNAMQARVDARIADEIGAPAVAGDKVSS